ncbi:hypothetical protein HNY73_014946 [Argiope bruennichi]|uniref:Uncharacterized protein n=1 Tax=Argiope bruennichi TaxID=94029 RepID=A0A8T0ESH8_ARGBR|nr:hypothetical protein HNY73_014946 [Argiope bruennichi]
MDSPVKRPYGDVMRRRQAFAQRQSARHLVRTLGRKPLCCPWGVMPARDIIGLCAQRVAEDDKGRHPY